MRTHLRGSPQMVGLKLHISPYSLKPCIQQNGESVYLGTVQAMIFNIVLTLLWRNRYGGGGGGGSAALSVSPVNSIKKNWRTSTIYTT